MEGIVELVQPNFSLRDKTRGSRGQSQGSHSLEKSFEF